MIAGIGVDIFSLGRLATMSDKEGFLSQVLTGEELRDAPQGEGRDVFCAMLCAAKEAILKALGCGLHPGFFWHDIAVFDGFRVCLSGRIRELAERQSIAHIHLSYSSSTHHAVAIALLETNTPEVTP
jgi:phosphopantetheine--protein transferase-like protein